MDFDIAGLLSNPDVLYMMAGLGSAIGKDNPFAVAAGNMTQQGIAAQNQKKLIMALLGQGGGAKAGESVGSGYDKISKQFLGADPTTNIRSDGKTATFTGPVGAFEGFGGGGGGGTQLSSMSPTPSLGGQSGIINPSVGLPGDLSGLSLAGLSPEDINKAITLGLTSSDLERKKVSDLYQNEYWRAMVEERRAARGAKEEAAPIEVPGVGQVSAGNWKNLPAKTQAYAYAMHLRRKNGQSMISPEEFDRQSDTNSTMQLIDRAMRDPGFKQELIDYRKAGAINIGELGARQEQHEVIKNWADIGTPKHRSSLAPKKEDRWAAEDKVDESLKGKNVSDTERSQMVDNAMAERRLKRFEQDIVSAKGRKISGPKWDPNRKVFVWIFINPRGKEEEITLER